MSALTLAQAKSYLKITSVDAARDIELQAAIDSAESSLSDELGPLASTPVTSRVTIFGYGDVLILPVIPVISLTSVTGVLSGVAITPLTDLHLDCDHGLVTYNDGLRLFWEYRYDVVYSAGYATVPADLLNGIKELVRDRWAPQRGGAGKPGTGADKAPDPADADDFPDSVMRLIERRRQHLGFA